MTSKVTQDHWKWHNSTGHISLSISVCSSNAAILHCFQDVITFTVYANACDL